MKSKILILLFVVSIVTGMIVPTMAFSDNGNAPVGNSDKGKAPAAEQSASSVEDKGQNPNTEDNDGIPNDLDANGGGSYTR